MDTGDSAFNDLVAQYNSMEKSSGGGNYPDMIASPSICLENHLPWYRKNMTMIVLFVWTLLLVVIGKPSIMYEEDPETKQWKLKPMRLLATVVIVFCSLFATFWGVRYFSDA